jgi:hypothetical protein
MKREFEMLKIPNSIPIKTRLPLSAWAVAAVLTLFSVASSMLHLSPVDHQANAHVETVTQPVSQAGVLSKQVLAAASGFVATIW